MYWGGWAGLSGATAPRVRWAWGAAGPARGPAEELLCPASPRWLPGQVSLRLTDKTGVWWYRSSVINRYWWTDSEVASQVIFFIGVKLLYNAALVAAVEQSESAMCIHVSPPSQPAPTPPHPTHQGHHGASSRAPRAAQQLPISYLVFFFFSVFRSLMF